MKKTLLILTVALSLVYTTQAQDIHFLQYQYAPITLNPALAGANHDVQGVLNYKTQWKSVATPYSTINASFDMRVLKFMKGFFASGLSVYNDKAGYGSLTTTTATLPIAYHLRLDRKNSLGAALYIAGEQKTISTNNFQWAKQYDGGSFNSALANGQTINKPSYVFLNFGVGVFYRAKDTVVIKSMFEYSNYSVGVAYDVNVRAFQKYQKHVVDLKCLYAMC